MLDKLIRDELHPDSMGPLDIVLKDGKLWLLHNRRLCSLAMFQATRQYETVFIRCRARVCVCVPQSRGFEQNVIQIVMAQVALATSCPTRSSEALPTASFRRSLGAWLRRYWLQTAIGATSAAQADIVLVQKVHAFVCLFV